MGVTLRDPSLEGELAKQKLRVGLYVPAFFSINCHWFNPMAIDSKKELHCHPSRKSLLRNYFLQ